MDPSTLIASASLASKIVPKTLQALGNTFASNNVEKNLPSEAVSFDKVFKTEALRADTVLTKGDEVARLLKSLPELGYHSQQGDWSQLSFEVNSRGDLTLHQPDGRSQEIHLTKESREKLAGIFNEVKESHPPYSPLGTTVNLTVASAPEAKGSDLSGRSFAWKPV